MPNVTHTARALLFSLAFICVTAPCAVADHVNFIATVGGERLKGAEVCFFRALKSENPVVLFGQDDRVVCLAADTEHEMRPGAWAFYVAHPSGYVTAYPDLMF